MAYVHNYGLLELMVGWFWLMKKIEVSGSTGGFASGRLWIIRVILTFSIDAYRYLFLLSLLYISCSASFQSKLMQFYNSYTAEPTNLTLRLIARYV